MIKTKNPSLPPEEVARIIEKTTGGNASEFARRMGVNEAIIRKYVRDGIKIEAIAWAFRSIDHYPHLVGGDGLDSQRYRDGQLSIIADVVGAIGLKQARALLLAKGLQNADARWLSPLEKTALLRLNSYHGIELIF